MIENQDGAWNHQERFGQSKFILSWERNFGLEKVDRFVANKTDGAARESRQFRMRYKLITAHQLSHFVEWTPAYLQSVFLFAFDDSNLASVTLHHHARIDANERKPSRDIILFGGLKKKAVTTAVQFLESRNWRFSVRDELCENRNDVALFRELDEFAPESE